MATATSELQIVISAKDEASSKMSTLGKSFAALGTAAAAAAVAGIAVIGKEALISAGQLEKTQIAFETMLGSAETAGQLLKDLTDFAARTPFDLPGVQNAAKQLLAMGAATEDDMIPVLKALGDVTAGTDADFTRIAYNFGQVATQGKLTGVELKDFARNGIPIIAQLADTLGVSEDAIKEMTSAGEIGFEDVRQAFMDMTSEGGKFEDLMFKQSSTLPGIIENIKDKFGILIREMVGMNAEGEQTEGIFTAMKDAGNFLLGVLELLGGEVNDNNRYLVEWVDKINESTGIIDSFKMLWEDIVFQFKYNLLPTIIENKDLFIDLAKVVGATLVVALGLFMTSLDVAIRTISLFIDWAGKLRNAIIEVGEFFKDLGSTVDNIFNTIGNRLNEFISQINTFVSQINTIYQNLVNSAYDWGWNIIQGMINGFNAKKDELIYMAQSLADSIKNTIKDALGISSPSKVFEEFGKQTIQGFLEGMQIKNDTKITQPVMEAASSNISVNFNNPVVRSDNDLDTLVNIVKQSLNRDLVNQSLGT